MGDILSRDITSWEYLDFTTHSAHQLPAAMSDLTFLNSALFFLQNAAKYPKTDSNKTAGYLEGILFIVFLGKFSVNGIGSVEVDGFYLTCRT